MFLVNFGGQPNLDRSDNKPVLFMVSNALVRSMNTMQTVEVHILFSVFFFDLSCAENRVGGNLFTLNPHCNSGRIGSMMVHVKLSCTISTLAYISTSYINVPLLHHRK